MRVPTFSGESYPEALLYAIIETGGKQYRVQRVTRFIWKTPFEAGETVEVNKVWLLVKDDEFKFGTPLVENARSF